MTVDNGSSTFWLASLQSKAFKATKTDPTTDVKKGEFIVKVIWFNRVNDDTLKYNRLEELSQVSVSSIVVTRSTINWQRTTTNRYYLGEFTYYY